MRRSIAIGQPIVYVSANYRLNGILSNQEIFSSASQKYLVFGFLSSKEVKNAGVGNLGLLDRARCIFCIIFAN